MSEPDVSDLLTVQQAIAIIDAVPIHPKTATISLDQASGLILAEALRADRDFPPFDKSQMDGYAVRAADVSPGATLRVIGEVAAGAASDLTVGDKQAVAIMTGAPMPAGADVVVPVEDVTVDGDAIRLTKSTTAGRFIARRGSDCREGAEVLPAGVTIGPAQIAVAAAVGATDLRVFKRPTVAVLSTGDEIVPIHQQPGPSQIRNSNSPMLVALLKKLNCDVIDLGHVPDDPAVIRSAIECGLQSDALFITGGMSMGKYDYVPRLLRELNIELKVTKLRIKPGKPFVFGSSLGSGVSGPGSGVEDSNSNPRPQTPDPRPQAFVFGLPGNPVSAFVCTLRFASRLLARMAGGAVYERWMNATLQSPLPANGPREFYQPARLIGSVAVPMNWKGSADIFTLAQADAFLVRPENEPALAAGSMVKLLEVPR